MVIFSGLLIQKALHGHTSFSVALEVSLDDAVAALRLLDIGNRISEKCIKYLEQLGRLADFISSFSPSSLESEHDLSFGPSNVELCAASLPLSGGYLADHTIRGV